MPAANAKRKNIRPSASKVNKKVMNYINHLETQIELLKNDPETALGQLMPQMREAIGQNKRLSVLAASIIDNAGGKITLSKASLESFESRVLSIKWELPEGVTSPDQAEEFIFSFEALTQEEVNAKQAAALAAAGESFSAPEAEALAAAEDLLSEESLTIEPELVEETSVEVS